VSDAERLRLNLLGYVENWPERFFGDPMEEIAAMTEEAARRHRGMG
jgi:hypothetical protein